MEKIIVINPIRDDVIAEGVKGKVIGKLPRFKPIGKYNVFEVEKVSDGVYLLKNVICSASNQLEFLKCAYKNLLEPKLTGVLDEKWDYKRLTVRLTDDIGNTTNFWAIDITKEPPTSFEFKNWKIEAVWRIELEDGFGFPVKVSIPGRVVMNLFRDATIVGEVRDKLWEMYSFIFSKYSSVIRKFFDTSDDSSLEEVISMVEFGEKNNKKAKVIVEMLKTFNDEKDDFAGECSAFIDYLANTGKKMKTKYVFDAVLRNLYPNIWDAYFFLESLAF